MKYCFLINNAVFLSEFSGKLAGEMIKRGDDCLVILGGKITEYEKKKFFPDKTRFLSVVDWRINNPKAGKEEFFGLSWKDFFPHFDRNEAFSKFDYNKSIEITLQTVQFFEFIFAKEKPDVVISERPTGLSHLVAYYFCKKNNSVYLGFEDSRLNNRIDIYDAFFTCSKYEKTFKEINNGGMLEEEKEFAMSTMEKFVSHELTSFFVGPAKIYFSQIGLIRHFLKRIKEVYNPLLRYILSRNKYKNFDSESEVILKTLFKAGFKAERKKFRIFFQKRFYKKYSKTDKFFLFPLQLQPEASTGVYAIYYCDQLSTVKNIAFSLPFPYKLYVKEHPAAVGTKPIEFYEKLKNIPNVVLISPSENVEELVKNSSGVITLTSTIGMEAALSGKPVYIFGDVFYSYHPLCRKIMGFEELKNKIEYDLMNKLNIDNLKDINNRFMVSYLRNTISGNTPMASAENDTNDYKLIYEGMLKILSNG